MSLRVPLETSIKTFLDEISPKWEEKWACGGGADDLDDPRAFARLRPADLLLVPEVKEAMMSDMDDLTIAARLSTLGDEMPQIVKDVYDTRRATLNDMVRQARPTFPQTASPVELAVCLFDCADPRCPKKFMTYPGMFKHRCGWMKKYWKDEVPADNYDRVVQGYMVDNYMHLAWHKLHVRVSSLMYTPMVNAIVSACGLNPEFASPADLDSCGVRMTCADCEESTSTSKEPTLEVFDWRRAVRFFPFLRRADIWLMAFGCSLPVTPPNQRAPCARYRTMPLGNLAGRGRTTRADSRRCGAR